jgi:hypothetical protein
MAMIDTANKGGNPMASKFKKTVSTFSMKKLRERGLFPLIATPLRNIGAKLATPLRNIGAKLVLFVSRAWLWHFLQSLIRRYRLVILMGGMGLIGLMSRKLLTKCIVAG